MSVSEAVDGAVYANTMFSEINYGGAKRLPIEIVTDNKSLCDALHSDKSVTDKRLRIEIGSLKEMLQTKDIVKVHWVETKYQLADALTKMGASTKLLLQVLHSGRLHIDL